jgi:hypothetical protein
MDNPILVAIHSLQIADAIAILVESNVHHHRMDFAALIGKRAIGF